MTASTSGWPGPSQVRTISGSERPARRSKYSCADIGFPCSANRCIKISQSTGSSSDRVPLKSKTTAAIGMVALYADLGAPSRAWCSVHPRALERPAGAREGHRGGDCGGRRRGRGGLSAGRRRAVACPPGGRPLHRRERGAPARLLHAAADGVPAGGALGCVPHRARDGARARARRRHRRARARDICGAGGRRLPRRARDPARAGATGDARPRGAARPAHRMRDRGVHARRQGWGEARGRRPIPRADHARSVPRVHERGGAGEGLPRAAQCVGAGDGCRGGGDVRRVRARVARAAAGCGRSRSGGAGDERRHRGAARTPGAARAGRIASHRGGDFGRDWYRTPIHRVGRTAVDTNLAPCVNRGTTNGRANPMTELSRDEQDLARFGYKQELKRSLGVFSSFAVAFSYISPSTGIFALFFLGLTTVGGIFIWSWPIVAIGQLIVALGFAELSSHYPVAGSVFQWTKYLAGKSYSWFTGWIYLFAGILTVASVCATLPYALIPAFQNMGWNMRLDSTNERWVAVITLVLITVMNIFGVRLVALVNNTGVMFEVLGMVVFALVLLIFYHHQSATVVFDASYLGSGF